MSALLFEGWDVYGSGIAWNNANFIVQCQRNWDTRSTTSGYQGNTTQPGRASGLCWQFSSDVSNNQFLQRSFGTPASTTFILAASWQPTATTGNANHAIFTIFDTAATEVGRLYLNGSSGQLVYRNGSGTTILTSTFAGGLITNTWYTIELKVLASTTVGTVDIHINAASAGSASSVNTVGAALTTGMGSLALGARANSANFNGHYLDHLIVMDGSGSVFNDFVGERRIYYLPVMGSGSHTDWTPTGAATNWQAVSEAGLDQDTSYVATATVGNTDSYNVADLSTSSMPVYAVQLSGHVKKDDSTARQVQLLVRSGGTDSLIGSSTSVNVDYSTRLVAIAPTNPVTSSAWTNSDVQALEAGIRVTV